MDRAEVLVARWRHASAPEEWCEEHNVAEAECIECNADLHPPGTDHGWCRAHGVAQCPSNIPRWRSLPKPPAISPARLEQAARALALRSREENNSNCALYKKRVQFASAEAVEKAGVGSRW